MRKPQIPPSIPHPGMGKRGETGYLGYLLRQAGVAHRLKMERALSDMAVTPPQFSVLTMVVAYPGISNADLARLSLLTPQTVSVIVANLERAGTITRRPHSVHGRIQHIEVTKTGKKLLTRCREHVHGIERQLHSRLTPPEEKAIRKWLVSLAVENDSDK